MNVRACCESAARDALALGSQFFEGAFNPAIPLFLSRSELIRLRGFVCAAIVCRALRIRRGSCNSLELIEYLQESFGLQRVETSREHANDICGSWLMWLLGPQLRQE